MNGLYKYISSLYKYINGLYKYINGMYKHINGLYMYINGLYLYINLKSKVYSNPIPKTTAELKQNIRREARRIQLSTVQSAVSTCVIQ